MSLINLLLVQSFIPNQGTYFNFNSVSWTLSVEAVFYISLPFLLWIFSKINVRTNIVKSILILIAVWTILFILNAKLSENNHFLVWLLHIFPISRLFEFSAGILLALIFVENSKKLKSINMTIFTVFEILILLFFVVALLFSVSLDVGIVRGVYFVPIWCLLIFTFAHHGGVLSKTLSNKFLVYLGEISFSFYMIHQLVIRYLSYLQLDKANNFIICLGFSLLLSALIYKYYEEPMRKRIRFGASTKEVLKNRGARVEQA